MPREITSHKVNGLNEVVKVEAVDDPGVGGACHKYLISIPVPAKDLPDTLVDRGGYPIHFQSGGIGEVGVNGISNESLLAVVEDRLIGFQSGQFACRENAVALTKLQECMMWLQKRTRDREARGVEGTLQK